MKISEIIRQRYSVRLYRNDPVEPEKLAAILEAARLAPTAANRQPFGIIVAQPKSDLEAFRRLYPREWFLGAPYVLVVCTVAEKAWVNKENKNYAIVDAALVVDHMVLQATELGLGTCIIAAFDPPTARELFKVPDGVEPVLMIALGYPAGQPGEKIRKSFTDLVHEGHW